MKAALPETPILVFYNFKINFILNTDTSFDTIGAVLLEKDDRIIVYGLHTINTDE